MTTTSASRRHAVLAVLLLVGTPCLAHLPELVGWSTCNPFYSFADLVDWHLWYGGTCVVDGNVGDIVQALGGLSARLWLQGRLPWWDHFAGAGLPLASTMQPGSFFLPFVLLLHLLDGPLYLKLVMQILSGLFGAAFLREIGLRRDAAVLGGMLFSLNGSFAYFGDAPIMPIPFLPLLLLGIARCRRALHEVRPGGPILVALAIGFSLLAGFPETAAVDGLFGLAWLLLALGGRGLSAAQQLRLACMVGAAGVVGLALASPVLIPFLRELPASSLGPHGSTFGNLFRPDQLAGLLFPSIFGAPMEDFDIDAWGGVWGYFGAGITCLAVLALLSRWRDPVRWLAAGWIGFFLLAAGGVPGFMQLRQHLPILDVVDFRRYPAASCEFAAILLAMLTLDDWLRARAPRRRSVGLGLSGLALFAAACLVVARHRLIADAQHAPLLLEGVTALLAGLVVMAGVAWLLCRPPGRRGMVGMTALVMSEALLSFMVPVWHDNPVVAPDLGPIAYLRAHQGLSRLHVVGPRLVPNYAGYFGIASIDDIFCPVPLAWQEQVVRMDPRQSAFSFTGQFDTDARTLIARRAMFEAYGVRYVLLPTRGDPLAGQPGFVRVYDGARSRLYEMPGAKPYFELSQAGCALSVADRDHLDAACDGPATLVRREMMFPGWRAFVNGHPTRLDRTALGFQSLDLPAGRSRVEWRYLPVDATSIAVAFGAGVLALAALLAAAAWPAQAAGLRRRSANCLRNFATLGAITTRQ